jgi:hypothetical protein
MDCRFGPGEYHAYYLPHSSQQIGSAFWSVSTTYTRINESLVSPTWRTQATAAGGVDGVGLPEAQFIELQPRVEFHRFTDMVQCSPLPYLGFCHRP